MSYCSVKAVLLGASFLASWIKLQFFWWDFFKHHMSVHHCLTFFLCSNFAGRLWAIWVLPELIWVLVWQKKVVWTGSVLPTEGRLPTKILTLESRVFVYLSWWLWQCKLGIGRAWFLVEEDPRLCFHESPLVYRFLKFANVTILLDGCKKAKQSKTCHLPSRQRLAICSFSRLTSYYCSASFFHVLP